jgi:hypothetical protein
MNTVLLLLILAVLLFGSSAVMGALNIGFWAFLGLALVGLLIFGAGWLLLRGIGGLAWLFDRKWLYWFTDIFVADPVTPGETKGQLMAVKFVGFLIVGGLIWALAVGSVWLKTGKWPL